MQPVKGIQEAGALGGIKGVGKGFAGAAFKPAAGKFTPCHALQNLHC